MSNWQWARGNGQEAMGKRLIICGCFLCALTWFSFAALREKYALDNEQYAMSKRQIICRCFLCGLAWFSFAALREKYAQEKRQ